MDIRDIFKLLWDKFYFISFFTTLFFVTSLSYSISLPNIYSSNAILKPASSENSLSSQLGSLSSLAGMAGVNISGAQGGNKSIEAIERIKSRDFFINNFLPKIELKNLHAVKNWNKNLNTIEYNSKIFNQTSNKWLLSKSELSPQKSYKEYKRILDISEDKKTLFVKISISHESPYVAQNWLNIIIKEINQTMKEEERISAKSSISFLTKESYDTNIVEIKSVLNDLLKSQMQTLMLISAENEYIYKVIESPNIPVEKISPSRALICILGIFLGGLMSVLYVLLAHIFRPKPA
jgi:LPS O-antigen subunit length determinant protein (WzzB/FepE family)